MIYFKDALKKYGNITAAAAAQIINNEKGVKMSDIEKFNRNCDVCNKGLNEGFYHEEAHEIYCSKKCLHADGYTEEEAAADIEADVLFYTTWEEAEEEEAAEEFYMGLV